MPTARAKPAPILVRLYAGSRLYDTAAGRYLMIDDLRLWAKKGVPFRVQDSKTNEDITRILLA